MTPEEQFASIRNLIEHQAEIGRKTDERLDRMAAREEKLEERHQALAQSVELLSQMHRDNEGFLRVRFAQMADAINRLAHIADIHDGRLGDHERRLDDLEDK